MCSAVKTLLLVFVVASALLAAGCGQSRLDKASDDFGESLKALALSQQRLAIYNAIEAGDYYGAINKAETYADSALAYVEDLGKDVVRDELRDAADSLEGLCDSCVEIIDRARDDL
jgi:hypothetical protein